ncbi:transposon Ty3-I Gag-Pol polyprotein [Trichonephila inaurata madagascariensis]|uniref:Transposon Ty3-I Gag-Pol polyprotein n=1 Tax=Trichonephila inaurata madagascariensis TaxID=2747483 RepID=A0A8X7CEK9_9ARAC|nr:transposon Ty3-I Gag-Pol polyprotein [Trichonephila inaurata madagascariensis]
MVGASDNAVEGVQKQYVNNHWQPLAFFLYTIDSYTEVVHYDILTSLANAQLQYEIYQADNIVADFLSRIDEICLPPTIDYAAMATALDSNQELTSLSNYNLKFDKLPVIGSEYMITCEVSTGQYRPYVPAAFRREIFERYLRKSHPGIRSSVKLMSKKFFWPNLRRDVSSRSRGCIECQKI